MKFFVVELTKEEINRLGLKTDKAYIVVDSSGHHYCGPNTESRANAFCKSLTENYHMYLEELNKALGKKNDLTQEQIFRIHEITMIKIDEGDYRP